MSGNADLNLQAVEEALRIAGIPENIGETNGAGLSMVDRKLYRVILRAFPELGGAPDAEWLCAAASALGMKLEATLAALVRHDLIVRDPTTGAITVAYPFSATPTPHRVQVAGARPVYAMCAVDALGIPFMLDRDATVVSADPTSGEPIRIELNSGDAFWEPAGTVVFVCRLRDCTGPECCTTINFFSSLESADAYRRAHPNVDGRVLALPEALEAGRRVFGNLLVDDDQLDAAALKPR